jgi:hypothetical protein
VASVSAFVLTIGGVFLGQTLEASQASAAGVGLSHSATTPVWARVTNWTAVWDDLLGEDAIFYSLDAADPSTDQDGTEDILWEATDWSADMSTYQTRAAMHWVGTSAGAADFDEYQFSSMATGRIGGTQNNPDGPLTAYFWSRDARQSNGPASCSEGWTPIVRVTSGDSAIYWSCMPAPKGGDGNTSPWPIVNADGRNDSLFSGGVNAGHATGGEVDQYSGLLYVESSFLSEADDQDPTSTAASTEKHWRFSVWDPQTGSFSLSGAVQPGDWYQGMSTPSQERMNIFANNDSAGYSTPYAPADFALDADGNAYMYTGTYASPQLINNAKLVRLEPARDAAGNIVDGSASNPWRYYVVEDILKDPTASNQAWDAAGGTYGTWGNAFLNGQLLNAAGTRTYNMPADAPASADACRPRAEMNAEANGGNMWPGPACGASTQWNTLPYPGTTNMVKIDPMSATAKIVYSVGNSDQSLPIAAAARDNASSQMAQIVRGTLWNDLNADGQIQADEPGLPNQTVGLYDDSGKLLSTQKTGSTGVYSFLTAGLLGEKYYVRPIQVQAPMSDGTMVNAVQTWGAGSTNGGNTATIQCGATANTVAGACSGALSPYENTDPAAGELGSTSAVGSWLTYGTVAMNTSNAVPTADFGFTARGSYGDAAAGPTTANIPSHTNGVSDTTHLGDTLGVYSGPAADNASHNATDDGVTLSSSSLGDIPLQDTTIAATHQNSLSAAVNGTAAAQTTVTGWTTPANSNTWNANAVWSPALSGDTATGAYQYQSRGTTTVGSTVQMRVNGSTASATAPDNSKSEYSGTSSWVTAGEIEDYSFALADAVYRPAVENSGSRPVTFQVNGESLTADKSTGKVLATAQAATPGQQVTVNAASQDASATCRTVTVTDTTTGAAIAGATSTCDGATASATFTPQLGDDIAILFSFGPAPSGQMSTLSIEPASGTVAVGGIVKATATVKDADGGIIAGATATFALDEPAGATTGSAKLSAVSCVTDGNGQCSVDVTDSEAEQVTLHGYVNGTNGQEEIKGGGDPALASPKTLTFTPGSARWDHSDLTVTPAGPLTVGEGAQNTYTATTTTRDENDNLVPGTTVTYKVTDLTGAAVNPDRTKLSSNTCTTGDQGNCSVTLTSIAAGKFLIHAQIPDQDNGGALKDVNNSPATVEYKAGNPDETVDPPVDCRDPHLVGTNLTADSPVGIGTNSTATAYVTDTYCNVVGSGFNVNFGVDGDAVFIGSGTDLQSAVVTTGADSKAIIQLTDDRAETVHVTAALDGGSGLSGSPATVVFTGVGPAHPSTSELEIVASDPTVVAADGTATTRTGSSVTLKATGKDINGTKVGAGTTFTFSVDDADGSATVTGSCVTQDDGTCEAIVRDANPETVIAHGFVNGGEIGTGRTTANPMIDSPKTITFKDDTASAEKSTLEVDRESQVVGDKIVATATAKNDAGTPMAGAVVTFALDEPTATDNDSAKLSALTCTTGDNGQCTVEITDTQAEQVVLHGYVNGDQEIQGGGVAAMASPKTLTFTHGKVDADKSHLTVEPSRQTAGSPVVATVTARDGYDNPITDLELSDFVMSGTAPQLPDLVFVQFANHNDGTYTFTTTSQLVGTFTVTATVDGVLLTEKPQVTFVAGDVCVDNCTPIDNPETPEKEDEENFTKIVMTTNDQPANGTAKDVAQASAYDQYGNVVASAVFTVTDATVGALADKLTPLTQKSDPTGDDAKVDVSWTSTTAGTYTANAKVRSGEMTEDLDVPTPATNGINSIRFALGNISAEKSQLIITPDHSQVVGSTFKAEAFIVDDQMNPIPGATVSFAVNSPWADNSKAAQLSDTTCETVGDGRCFVTLSSYFAGDYEVHATVPVNGQNVDLGGNGDPKRSSPQTVTFTPDKVCNPAVETCDSKDNPDTPEVDESKNQTSVWVDPNNAQADGTDRDGVNVFTVDKFGNPVDAAQVALSTTDSALTLLASSITTDATGHGVAYATSRVAGGHDVTATVEGKELKQSPVTLNFVSGALGDLTLTLTPAGPQEVGNVYTVTAKATDVNGNPLEAGVAFDLPAGLTTPDGQTQASCQTAASNGSCSIEVTSTKAGSYDITGEAGGLVSDPVTAVFTPGPVDADHSTAKLIVNGAKYDGIAHNVVEVTAMDRFDNPVPGAKVSSTPVAGSENGLTIQPDIAATDANGKTTIWYASTVPGQKTVDVRINDTVTPKGSPVTMYFGTDEVSPENSSWTITPDGPLEVGEGEDNTYTLTATVRNDRNELVADAAVTFGVDHDAELLDWTPDSMFCVSNAQGECSVTVSSTKAGTYAFTATLINGQIGQAQSRAWYPGPVDAAHSKVTVTVNNATADGSARDEVLVEAKDKYDNPVPNQTVVSEVGDATLVAQTGIKPTNEDGETTIWYTSTKAGDHTARVFIGPDKVEPKFPGASSPVTLTFKSGAANAEHSSLVVEPLKQIAGDNVTATATIRDINDNPVAGTAVALSVTGEGFFNTGGTEAGQAVTCTSGDDGVCKVTLTDKKAETVSVRATIDTAVKAGADIFGSPVDVTFTAGKGVPVVPNPEDCDGREPTNLTVDPLKLEIGGQATADAYITDKYCNPVANAPVDFGVDGSGSLVGDGVTGQATTVTTDETGHAIIKVTDNKVETVNVTAKIDDPATAVTTPVDIFGSPAPVTFEDTNGPNPPVITDPKDGALTNDNTPDISGTADEPGDTVTVHDKGPDGKDVVVCTATVAADKTWTCTPKDPMPDGDHTLTATQTDPAGNVSGPSNEVDFTIDTVAPNAPIIDTANGDEIGGTVPNTPDHPLDPGTIVTVTDEDGKEICTAEVQKDTTWSCMTPDGTPSGPITAVATDPAGNDSGPTTTDLDTDRPEPPDAESPNGSEVIGGGEPGDTIDVKGPDGKPVDGCQDVPIDKDGHFVCTPTTPLNPGDVIQVVETDPAGNESDPTEVIVGSLGIEFGYPTRQPQQQQTVTGTNFNPGEKVCLTVQSSTLNVGCQIADQEGRVYFEFIVPADFEVGTHTGTLTGEKSGSVSGTFEVTAANKGGGPVIKTGGSATTQEIKLHGLLAGLMVASAGVWVGLKRRRVSQG